MLDTKTRARNRNRNRSRRAPAMAAEAIAAVPLAAVYEQPLQAAYVRGLDEQRRREQHEPLQPSKVAAVRAQVRTLPLNPAHPTSVAAFVGAALDGLQREYAGDGRQLLADFQAAAGHCPVPLGGVALPLGQASFADAAARFPQSYGVYDRNPAAVVGIGKTRFGQIAVEVVPKGVVTAPRDPLFDLSLLKVHRLKAKDLLLCAAVQIVMSDVRAGDSLPAAIADLRDQLAALDGLPPGEAISGEHPYVVNWLPFTQAEADFAFGTKASVDEMPALAAVLHLTADTDAPLM